MENRFMADQGEGGDGGGKEAGVAIKAQQEECLQ